MKTQELQFKKTKEPRPRIASSRYEIFFQEFNEHEESCQEEIEALIHLQERSNFSYPLN